MRSLTKNELKDVNGGWFLIVYAVVLVGTLVIAMGATVENCVNADKANKAAQKGEAAANKHWNKK